MASTSHSAMESALVVASNRGPVAFERGEDGKLIAHRGSGGLVTVLGGVLERDDATWVAAAVTEGDREVAPRGRKLEGAAQRVRYVDIPEQQYDAYYNGIANRRLVVRPPLPVGYRALPDFRRTDRGRMGRLCRSEPGVRSVALGRGEARSDLPDPGLPPHARSPHAARDRPGGADPPLLPHTVRGADLLPDPARRDAAVDPARHAGLRRRRLPGTTMGRELSPLGSGAG